MPAEDLPRPPVVAREFTSAVAAARKPLQTGIIGYAPYNVSILQIYPNINVLSIYS